MFGLFKPKSAEVAPVEVAQPESKGTILRERMETAKQELVKINKVIKDHTAVKQNLEADLFASADRSAKLMDAIAIGRQHLNSGQGGNQLKVNLEKARLELEAENMKQIPLEAQIDTIRRFLETIELQKQELEEDVNRLDGRLTTLEVREIGANILKTVGEVETGIKDYRTDVYTKEAYRELASGV